MTNTCTNEFRTTGSGAGMLTMDQAAQRIGVSTRTMRRLMSTRQIRFLRIGGLVRFQAGDVDAFLSECAVQALAYSTEP